MRERVDNLRVSLLGLAFGYLCQSLFPNVSALVQGLGEAHSSSRGVSLPEDVMSQEAHRVCSEQVQARRQRR
jgi:hypothetical protein